MEDHVLKRDAEEEPEEAAAVGRLIEKVDGRCGETLRVYVGQ